METMIKRFIGLPLLIVSLLLLSGCYTQIRTASEHPRPEAEEPTDEVYYEDEAEVAQDEDDDYSAYEDRDRVEYHFYGNPYGYDGYYGRGYVGGLGFGVGFYDPWCNDYFGPWYYYDSIHCGPFFTSRYYGSRYYYGDYYYGGYYSPYRYGGYYYGGYGYGRGYYAVASPRTQRPFDRRRNIDRYADDPDSRMVALATRTGNVPKVKRIRKNPDTRTTVRTESKEQPSRIRRVDRTRRYAGENEGVSTDRSRVKSNDRRVRENDSRSPGVIQSTPRSTTRTKSTSTGERSRRTREGNDAVGSKSRTRSSSGSREAVSGSRRTKSSKGSTSVRSKGKTKSSPAVRSSGRSSSGSSSRARASGSSSRTKSSGSSTRTRSSSGSSSSSGKSYRPSSSSSTRSKSSGRSSSGSSSSSGSKKSGSSSSRGKKN